MCDYSEQLAARDFCRRKAKIGDELELIHVAGSLLGFALKTGHGSRRRDWTLTCLRHGTEIAFERRQVLHQCRSFVECDTGERMLVNDIMPREARMLSTGHGGDRLEFANGLVCGISAIDLGMKIKVLQLPAVKQRKRKASMEAEREQVRELQTVER
jgi:hypothetical protein